MQETFLDLVSIADTLSVDVAFLEISACIPQAATSVPPEMVPLHAGISPFCAWFHWSQGLSLSIFEAAVDSMRHIFILNFALSSPHVFLCAPDLRYRISPRGNVPPGWSISLPPRAGVALMFFRFVVPPAPSCSPHQCLFSINAQAILLSAPQFFPSSSWSHGWLFSILSSDPFGLSQYLYFFSLAPTPFSLLHFYLPTSSGPLVTVLCLPFKHFSDISCTSGHFVQVLCCCGLFTMWLFFLSQDSCVRSLAPSVVAAVDGRTPKKQSLVMGEMPPGGMYINLWGAF